MTSKKRFNGEFFYSRIDEINPVSNVVKNRWHLEAFVSKLLQETGQRVCVYLF